MTDQLANIKGTRYTRANVGDELYDEILQAGALLNGTVVPQLSSDPNVINASDYTTYLETDNGDLWQKRNGEWSIFANLGPGGTPIYEVSQNRPTASTVRADGHIWYYKPVGSTDIKEVYISVKAGEWILLSNFNADKTLWQYSYASQFWGDNAQYVRVFESPAAITGDTRGYLLKHEINPPSVPTIPGAQSPLYNQTNGYRRGSRLLTQYGMAECIEPDDAFTQWEVPLASSFELYTFVLGINNYNPDQLNYKYFTPRMSVGGQSSPSEFDYQGTTYVLNNYRAEVDPQPSDNYTNGGYDDGSIWNNKLNNKIWIRGNDQWIDLTGGGGSGIADKLESGSGQEISLTVDPTNECKQGFTLVGFTETDMRWSPSYNFKPQGTTVLYFTPFELPFAYPTTLNLGVWNSLLVSTPNGPSAMGFEFSENSQRITTVNIFNKAQCRITIATDNMINVRAKIIVHNKTGSAIDIDYALSLVEFPIGDAYIPGSYVTGLTLEANSKREVDIEGIFRANYGDTYNVFAVARQRTVNPSVNVTCEFSKFVITSM